MLKLSRNLLDSMDKFVIQRSAPARHKFSGHSEKRSGASSSREQHEDFAEMTNA
jgi:hypothetical protein